MVQVLLAGDVSNRDAVASTLSDAGLSVVHAEDAVAAVERLEATPIDCLLLGAPDPDRFVRDIQRRGHDVPVLVDGENGRAMTFEAEGVVDTGAPEQLVERVEAAVASERIERERAARRRREAAVAAARAALDGTAGDDALAALCERLASSDSYAVAWLGRHDAASGAVVPRAVAGVPEAHLGAVPVGDDAENVTASAVDDGSVAVEADGDHAYLAVPVGDGPLAVLHLYAGRPDGVPASERETLADLGDALADRLAAPGDGADADERLSVLGDTLAHELGNQLDLATMHLDLAREEDDASHFEYVETALERMSELAEDARALARGDVSPEAVPLREAARDAWAAVDTGAATLDPREGVVEADRDLLELLLENLLRNAVQHGGEDVTVTVGPLEGAREDAADATAAAPDAADEGAASSDATAPDADSSAPAGADGTAAGFYVADDGPGIPTDERDAVFDWGYSTDGTGVGLGIVSLVAERHGWTVDLTESEAGGARFEFR